MRTKAKASIMAGVVFVDEQKVDFASIDVSFILLTKVLLVAFSLTKESGEVVVLIKPQFAAGRE